MSPNGTPPLPFAQDGESKIDIFDGKDVRKTFHNGEWWFAINDLIEALLDTPDGGAYIRKIKERDEAIKSGWDQIVTPLPYETAGGKQSINFVNIEGIFRILQSVPSPKADPFKKWLAKVGFERVQEIENPDLAIKRAMVLYAAKGYPPEWIEARIQNRAARETLEEEWKSRGVEGKVYGILTDAISVETFGIKTGEHKKIKGLASQPLRDNMTPIELTLTTLGEQATTEIARVRNAQGFFSNLQAAKSGGAIAGKARNEIELATGEKVVKSDNYLTEQQRKNNAAIPEGLRGIVKKIAPRPENGEQK